MGPLPQSQTVNKSQVFVFNCSNPTVSSLPTWIINGIHYFPSELPSNYYVNETGLVGVARVGMNGSTYQCIFLATSFNGMQSRCHELISTPAAVLTVLESGE